MRMPPSLRILLAALAISTGAIADQQIINTGAAANDNTGAKARDAFTQVNANFTDLYNNKVSEDQLNQAKAYLQGTTAEIIITPSVDGLGRTTFVFSTPQPMATTSNVQFNNGTFTGQLSGGGTTTNDNASAGQIGEFRDIAAGSLATVSLAVSGTTYNIVTLTGSSPLLQSTLTAGDWDCYGSIQWTGTATSVNYCEGGVSTASATAPTARYRAKWLGRSGSFSAGDPGFAIPTQRISVPASTTQDVWLTSACIFSGGTAQAYGSLSCRRAR